MSKNEPASPKGTTSTLEAPDAEPAESRSLDKIRDILVGKHARDQEERLTRMEERLLQECRDLRQETDRRLEALESFTKKELGALGDRLRTEGETREELEATQTAARQDAVKSLSKKISSLQEQLSAAQRELREEILKQAKSLLEEQRRGAESLNTSLDRETKSLRAGKLDRGALAAMFNDIALQLSDEEQG